MSNALHYLLLLLTHLLLAGWMLGNFIYMMSGASENRVFRLAQVGVGLTVLLLVWVGALVIWRLKQRRWGRAGVLVLLLLADALSIYGSLMPLYILGMGSGPG